ncbi:hypothetical protein B9Z55_018888 [Caenorhabditis nigoni]|uniref:Uncharacterized protein n=1 Tax=Caenorhabditis nigoni TaxID=1611254 RepID=A0A2G5TG77_9PELO|nr:hypothetical protein B9Z55_018888 [Caenorhabditis nigoni]
MVSMESAMEKSAMKNTNDSSTFISKIHLSGSGYGHLEFSSPDTVIFNDAVVRQVDAQTLAGLVGVTTVTTNEGTFLRTSIDHPC